MRIAACCWRRSWRCGSRELEALKTARLRCSGSESDSKVGAHGFYSVAATLFATARDLGRISSLRHVEPIRLYRREAARPGNGWHLQPRPAATPTSDSTP